MCSNLSILLEMGRIIRQKSFIFLNKNGEELLPPYFCELHAYVYLSSGWLKLNSNVKMECKVTKKLFLSLKRKILDAAKFCLEYEGPGHAIA